MRQAKAKMGDWALKFEAHLESVSQYYSSFDELVIASVWFLKLPNAKEHYIKHESDAIYKIK